MSFESADDQHRSVSATYCELAVGRGVLITISLGSVLVSGFESRRSHGLTFAFRFSPGELPPPAPEVFGRNELVERVVSLAQKRMPIALIGPSGIGKTSIALTALHDNRIRQQFGYDRRFIRCDQFTASRANLLSRLSEVLGSGIKNPQNLTALRPFLASKAIMVVFGNAESILDPWGAGSHEIYTVMEELSRIPNICVCITSRISTVPSDCKCLDVPTLSMKAARETFYSIYRGKQDSRVDNVLEQLDFHPLSITLLAAVSQRNNWNADRLTGEWEKQRMAVPRAEDNPSLAATIQLSLASPIFERLGPSARELLSIIAFFPQGIDEKDLEWLFPGISSGADLFDEFCALSLSQRAGRFITMLAPLRGYLRPKDPSSSQPLCEIKQSYYARLMNTSPVSPEPEQLSWIISEDTNIEHLLDVFTAIDETSDGVWDICANFMEYLALHKPRLVALGARGEELPDDHRSKPECLFWLARLYGAVGNGTESKRLLIRTLKLWRERGDGHGVARTMTNLCDVNRVQGLHGEGIELAREAIEICERLDDPVSMAQSLHSYTLVLVADGRLEDAEMAASQAVNLHQITGDQFGVCRSLCVLGKVCWSKGETEDARGHFEEALEIASPSGWHDQLSSVHHALAWVFFEEGNLDDAHIHIERAKVHALNDKYKLGHAMEARAWFWCTQRKFEDAKSEALSSIDVFKRFGISPALERCEGLLGKIQWVVNSRGASSESNDGESLGTALPTVVSAQRDALQFSPHYWVRVTLPAGFLISSYLIFCKSPTNCLPCPVIFSPCFRLLSTLLSSNNEITNNLPCK